MEAVHVVAEGSWLVVAIQSLPKLGMPSSHLHTCQEGNALAQALAVYLLPTDLIKCIFRPEDSHQGLG
eukprot:998317-Pelagomonas_calceolata.AAC.1